MLRRSAKYKAILGAFAAGCDRFGFRLIHYAVLNDHIHMLVEAADRDALRRGLQGLLIRVARALNKLWSRKGKVFADRYHDHILRSLREVRSALRYVLQNGHKHGRAGCHVRVHGDVDVFTSGPWFDGWLDGWLESVEVRVIAAHTTSPPPSAAARSWLLRTGWQRHGKLSPRERVGV